MFLSSEIADNFASRQPFLFAIDSPNKTRYYEIHPLGVKASRSLKIQAICTRNSIQLGWNRLNGKKEFQQFFDTMSLCGKHFHFRALAASYSALSAAGTASAPA
jgi:hypothetical protein